MSTLSCQLVNEPRGEYRVSYNPQYGGTTGQPISISVVNEVLPTTQPGPYTLRLYTDNPIITLKAIQQGTAGGSSFTYNWLAACNGGTTPPANQPPTASGIPNQMATVGQPYSLNVAPFFADSNGDALGFTASGLPTGLSLAGSTISGIPASSGVSSVTVTATDPGNLSVKARFELRVNPAAGDNPPPSAPFAIMGVTTVSCQTVSTGLRRVSFTPQYTGTNGQPISFSVVNEMLPTTQPGPYTINLYTDNPIITLKAVQQGTAGEASFNYNWLAVCNGGSSGARQGAESTRLLDVRILGNPVQRAAVLVEVRDGDGESLRLQLTDGRGQVLGTQVVERAGSVETHRFYIGRAPAGMLLLRATTPTRSQTVKVLRAD